MRVSSSPPFVFCFTDPATTEIYTLSLHDALPISLRSSALPPGSRWNQARLPQPQAHRPDRSQYGRIALRSEEHTSELQSQFHLVCRLLLEKKKPPTTTSTRRRPPPRPPPRTRRTH